MQRSCERQAGLEGGCGDASRRDAYPQRTPHAQSSVGGKRSYGRSFLLCFSTCCHALPAAGVACFIVPRLGSMGAGDAGGAALLLLSRPGYATSTRFRPPRLAAYNATSAASSSMSALFTS